MNPSRCTFDEIGNALRAARRVVILSHARPDGDAIGSQLGLGLSLRAAGIDVHMLNEDGAPASLAFLPGSDQVALPDGEVAGALLVALDTANRVRLGEKCLAATAAIERTINIDHHKSNDSYAQLNYVDASAPATGQIVYELLADQDFPISREVAENLFVAISTDTGSFRYPSTTARTYEIAAALVRAGADPGSLAQQTYESYPVRRIELLKELLNVYKLTCDGRVASWVLSGEVKERLGLQPDDSENLLDLIRGIDSVVVAVFFEQLPGGRVRVSMRSKSTDADVAAICAEFGGGGHTLAAGARVRGEIAEVERQVLDTIHETIQR